MKRYWNYNIFSFLLFVSILVKISFIGIYEKVLSFFYSYYFKQCGKNVFIQMGAKLRYPGRIVLGNNIRIGRNSQFDSELVDGSMIIHDNVQINKECSIDFSGDIEIGKGTLISECSYILTHNHGYDPRSKPIKTKLKIEENVWIGSFVKIMPSVSMIGRNSIISPFSGAW